MATITGNEGSVTWISAHGGTTQENILYAFDVSFANTVTEVTGYAQTKVRSHRGGLIDISGSCIGSLDSGAAPDVDSAAAGGATIVLLAQTGNSWTFTGLISNFRFANNKRDNSMVVTYEFVGGDADVLTEAWT